MSERKILIELLSEVHNKMQDKLVEMLTENISRELRIKKATAIEADYLLDTGQIIVLPCKYGTEVYKIIPKCKGGLDCPYNGGRGFSRCDKKPCEAYVEKAKFDSYMIDLIDDTIFLTREKAEKALEAKKK